MAHPTGSAPASALDRGLIRFAGRLTHTASFGRSARSWRPTANATRALHDLGHSPLARQVDRESGLEPLIPRWSYDPLQDRPSAAFLTAARLRTKRRDVASALLRDM